MDRWVACEQNGHLARDLTARDDEDDDFDDRPARSSGEMGPLDGMYKNTNIVVLILFALCSCPCTTGARGVNALH